MAHKLFGILSVALAGFLLAFMGCKNDSSNPYSYASPPPTSAKPNTVLISDMAFGPASMTVAKNATITWQNNDGVAHTSTSDSGVWDTGLIAPGGSKTTTFATTGTFPFHCTKHPMMTGTIIVQ
jgi:plastocyanin